MPVSADKTLEELFKFRLGQLRKDSEDATASISQITRVIAYGLAALIIPFVTADPTKMPLVVKHYPLWMFFAAMLGGVAIACDFLQNHFADRCARQELSRLTDNLHKAELVVSSPAEFMASSDQSWERDARKNFYLLNRFHCVWHPDRLCHDFRRACGGLKQSSLDE
jgi:hypothetical protein